MRVRGVRCGSRSPSRLPIRAPATHPPAIPNVTPESSSADCQMWVARAASDTSATITSEVRSPGAAESACPSEHRHDEEATADAEEPGEGPDQRARQQGLRGVKRRTGLLPRGGGPPARRLITAAGKRTARTPAARPCRSAPGRPASEDSPPPRRPAQQADLRPTDACPSRLHRPGRERRCRHDRKRGRRGGMESSPRT